MTPRGFYQSAAWLRLRAQVLREEPTCRTPGCGQRSTHADHVRPIDDGGAALDRANLQGLCQSCHSRKTASFDGGHGNPRRAGAVRAKGCLPDGTPRDPGHHWRRDRP